MLADLASTSRVWIFQSSRKLSEFESNLIRTSFEEFIPQWAAHGSQLFGAFELLDSYFIVVGVDESMAMASGCSVDKLMHKVQEIGKEIEIDFMNRLNIAYLDEDEIKLTSMNDFKALIREGVIDQNTKVFNNLVTTKAELESSWRTTVENSWHKNLLEIA